MELRAAFCSRCGRPLNGRDTCECSESQVAATAEPLPTAGPPDNAQASPPPPIGLWVRMAWNRFAEVARFAPPTAELSLEAAGVSLLARALLMAFLLDRMLNSLLGNAGKTIGGIFGMLGGLESALQMNIFLWAFLAFGLATAASVGILYWQLGKSRLAVAGAIMADAGWPPVLGLVAAWLLGQVWAPLAAIALPVGIAWGQAVLVMGLDTLGLPFRKRITTHWMIVGATLIVISLVSQWATDKL